MNERDVSIICDYILDLKEPKAWLRPSAFANRSYARWAANEILRRVRLNPSVPAEIVISNFAKKMSLYAKDNPRNKRIYDTAYFVTMDLIEIFQSMK